MSNWQIKWTKAQTDHCDFTTRSLFAVGVNCAGGRFEQTGLMDPAKATFLSMFAGNLYCGMSGRQAYDAAEAALTDEGRRLLALTGGRAGDPITTEDVK